MTTLRCHGSWVSCPNSIGFMVIWTILSISITDTTRSMMTGTPTVRVRLSVTRTVVSAHPLWRTQSTWLLDPTSCHVVAIRKSVHTKCALLRALLMPASLKRSALWKCALTMFLKVFVRRKSGISVLKWLTMIPTKEPWLFQILTNNAVFLT